jgi:hypothetical protein
MNTSACYIFGLVCTFFITIPHSCMRLNDRSNKLRRSGRDVLNRIFHMCIGYAETAKIYSSCSMKFDDLKLKTGIS